MMENELGELVYIYIGLLKQCELGLIEVPSIDENAYKRIETSLRGDEWQFITTETISNIVPITFPLAEMPWGLITHFGIFNKLEVGKLLAIGDLTRKGRIGTGMQVQFDIGSLEIAIEALGIT